MLADEQNSVYGQPISSSREHLGDGRINLHVGKDAAAAQVTLRELIHVKGDQVHGGEVVFSVPPVAPQKAVQDMLGVGVAPVF